MKNHFWAKSAFRFCLFVVALILGSLSISQVAGVPINPESRITISFNNTRFRDAIQQLFEGRASATVDPDVDGIITKSFKNEQFQNVLRAVCTSAGATYRIERGVYSFMPKDSRDFGDSVIPNPDRTLAIQFTNTPVQEAFRMLIGSDLSVDADVAGTINGNHRFTDATEAICWIADQSSSEVYLENGRYRVRRKIGEHQAWMDTNVQLKEDKADIRDALRALFRQVNVNYSIAPEVQGMVSCDLHGKFPMVLMRVLGAMHSFYRLESGVIQIVHERSPQGQSQSPSTTSFHVGAPRAVDIPDRFKKVTTPSGLRFEHSKIDTVLSKLFTRVPNRYVLKQNYDRELTVDLSKMPLDLALENVVRGTPLTVRFVDGVFIFDTVKGFVPPGIIVNPPDRFFVPGLQSAGDDWVIGDPPD